MWKVIQIQFFQGSDLKFTFKSGNISIAIFSFLQCGVLFGLFGSYLFSSLLEPYRDKTFTQENVILKDLSENKRRLVSITPEPWLENEIQNKNVYPYRALRAAMKNKSFELVEGFFSKSMVR